MLLLPEPVRIAADLMHLLYIADEYTDVEPAADSRSSSWTMTRVDDGSLAPGPSSKG